MGQNNYVEQRTKEKGRRFDYIEHLRKEAIKDEKKKRLEPQFTTGKLAKLKAKKRYKEKVNLKQKLKSISSRSTSPKTDDDSKKPVSKQSSPLPVFLMDTDSSNASRQLSQSFKERKKTLARTNPLSVKKIPVLNEFEVLKELRAGKKGKKSWKRIVRKLTFVGEEFTRKPPKYEKYIRPSALRIKKAHVSHPLLKTTFQLDILGVKENPQSKLFSNLGVLTKGTIIEVNVAELGQVTVGGKVVWGKYAQVTNKPEFDGCVNAVLLV